MVGALITGVLVFGAVMLSLQEGVSGIPLIPTPRQTLPPPNLTPLPGSEGQTPEAAPSALPVPALSPTPCPPPTGWEAYTVSPGDSLRTLAETRGSSLEQIMAGNCLIGEMLLPNVIVFLPPLRPVVLASENNLPTGVTPLQSATPACQQPAGWNVYMVQSGNTLTRIAIAYRISVSYLKQVNCLTSDIIHAGMRLWVPNVPTSTFTATATATRQPSDTPVPPPAATATHTPTATFTPTSSPEPTFTDTPTATATPTDTPTTAPTETATPTNTETPIPTQTPT